MAKQGDSWKVLAWDMSPTDLSILSTGVLPATVKSPADIDLTRSTVPYVEPKPLPPSGAPKDAIVGTTTTVAPVPVPFPGDSGTSPPTLPRK